MSLIEGFGDEVIEVFAILAIALLCLIAWRSTAIREFPQIRTVVILERRSSIPTLEPRSTTDRPEDNRGIEQASSSNVQNVDGSASSDRGDNPDSNSSSPVSENTRDVNSKRISYFSRRNEDQPSTSSSDNVDPVPGPSTSSDSSTEYNPSRNLDPERMITIKLKYINDDQKIVQGNLEELLGDFKRRCFEEELSNNKSVLLIFNGQVLSEDRSLAAHGLYNDCVIHCIVKAGAPRGATASPDRPPEESPEWNLGAVLSSTASLMLGTAWLAQISCPHFFTIFSTSALISLTALFALSFVSIHFPQYLPSSSS